MSNFWKGLSLEQRQEVRAMVLKVSDGHCIYCGVILSPETVEIDHFIPTSKGGGGGDNLVPSCVSCNRGKRDRSIEEYRMSQRRKAAGEPHFSRTQVEWLIGTGFVFPEWPDHSFWFEVEGIEIAALGNQTREAVAHES